MTPRLKPNFNHKEIFNAFSLRKNAVSDFESKFAEKFEARHAVAFMYGRSGLYALLKCLDITDSEIILPAYTCVVVAHAVVESGNTPCFVDIDLDNFNMNLDMVEKAITPKTKAIISTSLFGYPYDVARLKDIVKKSGQGILLIQDCAHSFGVEFNDELICNQGNAALFGMNISKQISSVFGGMITTNDESIYTKLKDYRDREFAEPSFIKSCKQLLYFLSTYITFSRTFYGFVNFLETRTPLLDRFTKYYEDETIEMPRDFMCKMPAVNARVGIAQIQKYEENKKRRREIAEFYNSELSGIDGLTLPSLIDGATYSHYVPRVDNRKHLVEYMRKKGVHIGELIEYSIPDMKAYENHEDGEYPNSLICAQNTINLPNYPGIREAQLKKIVGMLKDY